MFQLFKKGRGSAHAFINCQSKEQLDLEYILNTPATVMDNHSVEVAGERFQADNLVLGTGAETVYPTIPRINLHGVYDFSILIEDLDFEPQLCVIITCFFFFLKNGPPPKSPLFPTTTLSR